MYAEQILICLDNREYTVKSADIRIAMYHGNHWQPQHRFYYTVLQLALAGF